MFYSACILIILGTIIYYNYKSKNIFTPEAGYKIEISPLSYQRDDRENQNIQLPM